MQAYSDPRREDDPYALPDLEIFHIEDPHSYEPECWSDYFGTTCDDSPPACLPGAPCTHAGYYWWSCFPGCLPDSDPIGPFASAEEALADAREGLGD